MLQARTLTKYPWGCAGLFRKLGECNRLVAILESLKEVEVGPDFAHCKLHWLQLVRSRRTSFEIRIGRLTPLESVWMKSNSESNDCWIPGRSS